MLVPTVCRAVFLLRRDDHRVVRARKWRMTHIAGAFAALPVCCRGDLRSPADDAPHRKRTVGRWLAAAESAEMVMAGARDRPTASEYVQIIIT